VITLHPDSHELLEMDWGRSITEWTTDRLVDLPQGISRHNVRFVAYDDRTYAIKELPTEPARQDHAVLHTLEALSGPAVRPVGLVIRNDRDPNSEEAAVVISRYLDYSFSYRELISGAGFGARRNQLLDAFAWLLVELHLLGCIWRDCSLSNVLYRWDADAIETTLVDAETAAVHPSLSDGQRHEDLEIMIENVAGEMGDIAASQGKSLDEADLEMGFDIAERYHGIWAEVRVDEKLEPDQHYKVAERVRRINELGLEVAEVELVPHDGDEHEHLHLKLKVADRHYYSNRLRELTGVDAGEHQARQILSDLRYYEVKQLSQVDSSNPTGMPAKALIAARWRVDVFEPMLRRVTEVIGPAADPVQAYCDLLYHRYILSVKTDRDVGTEAAFEDWVAAGRPGYPIEVSP
jgi:hypothetical protein